jgi:hypothetical protein
MLKWYVKERSERMRDLFPRLVGNEALRRTLAPEMAGGKFSHAYILGGPKGSGKHTLAMEMIMAASCEHRNEEGFPLPCGTCRTCRKIRDGLCPDVITVRREEDRKTFGIDVIREMRGSVAVVPNDLNVKFYILEEAHLLTTEAQNALLLTLEEPPPFVCFFLLADDTDVLLETVRSRAPIHRLCPIPHETLSDHLRRHAAGAALAKENPMEFKELLLLSDGWIGRAESLLDPNRREPLLQRRRFAAQMTELLAANDRAGFYELLLARGADREKLTEDVNALSKALRDLLLLSKSEHAPLLFYTDREAAADLSSRFTATKLLSLLAVLDEAKNGFSINANVKITVTRLTGKMFAL